MARNLHSEITARILKALKRGVAPWRKQWSGGAVGGMPRNAVTGRAYSGANIPLLWMTADDRGYTDPRWLTFKQALDAGGAVRKGEKSTMVIFVSAIDRDEDGKLVRIPFLKSFNVFNVAQCDGLTLKSDPPRVLRNPQLRDAEADAYLASSGARITHSGARAYYSTRDDLVNLPAFETF